MSSRKRTLAEVVSEEVSEDAVEKQQKTVDVDKRAAVPSAEGIAVKRVRLNAAFASDISGESSKGNLCDKPTTSVSLSSFALPSADVSVDVATASVSATSTSPEPTGLGVTTRSALAKQKLAIYGVDSVRKRVDHFLAIIETHRKALLKDQHEAFNREIAAFEAEESKYTSAELKDAEESESKCVADTLQSLVSIIDEAMGETKACVLQENRDVHASRREVMQLTMSHFNAVLKNSMKEDSGSVEVSDAKTVHPFSRALPLQKRTLHALRKVLGKETLDETLASRRSLAQCAVSAETAQLDLQQILTPALSEEELADIWPKHEVVYKKDQFGVLIDSVLYVPGNYISVKSDSGGCLVGFVVAANGHSIFAKLLVSKYANSTSPSRTEPDLIELSYQQIRRGAYTLSKAKQE